MFLWNQSASIVSINSVGGNPGASYGAPRWCEISQTQNFFGSDAVSRASSVVSCRLCRRFLLVHEEHPRSGNLSFCDRMGWTDSVLALPDHHLQQTQ